MKLITALIVVIGSATCAWVAHSETTSIALQGGWTAPSGDLAQVVGDGFHFGLSATYPIDPHTGAVLDVNYHVLPEKTSILRVWGFPLALKERANILETMLSLRVLVAPVRSPLAPYIKAGLGAEYVQPNATISTQYGSIRANDSHVWIGMLGGIGLSTPLSASTGVRLEAAFHGIQSDTKPTDLVTLDLRLWTSGR